MSELGKKKKRKKRFRFFLFEVLLIVVLIPIIFLYFMISKIPMHHLDEGQIVMNKVDDPNMKNYHNIVLFGVDSRANELDKQTRSDSIIIASINKYTQKVKLVSVYRDTYVYINEKHGYTKINHAYAYGGPELAISALNQNFDLNIKDFVTVNFSALSNVIDALGGVTIDIKPDELKYVNAYTRDVARINHTKCVYLKSSGTQVLSGTQATAYCRVRYTSGGDFTRAERQRTVMKQIVKKAKSSDLPTLYSVGNEMLPQIYTSMNPSKIMGFSSLLFFYKIQEDTGFPFEKTPKMIHGASVVVPKTLSSNVSELHQYLFGTAGYTPTDTVNGYSKEIQKRQ
jgi:cell envelope-related function transcriptional attenuator common domain